MIIKLAEELPETKAGQLVRFQVIGSGTMAGANYHTVCSMGINTDFVSGLFVEEECYETPFWFGRTEKSRLIKK
jgi:hypothetical protein